MRLEGIDRRQCSPSVKAYYHSMQGSKSINVECVALSKCRAEAGEGRWEENKAGGCAGVGESVSDGLRPHSPAPP